MTLRASTFGDVAINRVMPADRAVHDWYRFVLSFPPHLVRDYLEKFNVGRGGLVLDPFCGTGTTLVECKKNGIASVGLEANAMAHFASSVKLDWTPRPEDMISCAREIAQKAQRRLKKSGFSDEDLVTGELEFESEIALKRLSPDQEAVILRNSISPVPLHKILTLRELIDGKAGERFRDHLRLALARVIVFQASNLSFGPEVGLGAIKEDAPVVRLWLEQALAMARDIENLRESSETPARAIQGDARTARLDDAKITAVFTSPPYPNEKDYTRTTRLESVILGFINNKAELKALKQGLIRSNTRNVYKVDQDDSWVANCARVRKLAAEIERRRIELKKTSGFERLYARVTELYFGGMARHLESLKPMLARGAKLGYVVGDQASYFRVLIRTGEILAEIAETLGYKVEAIDLFRLRRSTVTGDDLREEVVILTWPGK